MLLHGYVAYYESGSVVSTASIDFSAYEVDDEEVADTVKENEPMIYVDTATEVAKIQDVVELVAGTNDTSFEELGFVIDDKHVEVEIENKWTILDAEEYAELADQEIGNYMNALLGRYLYTENGETLLQEIYNKAVASMNAYIEASDFTAIRKVVNTAEVEMDNVLHMNEELVAIAKAQNDAKADVRAYAATMGLETMPDDVYDEIDAANTVAAVSEAKLVAMDKVDAAVAAQKAALEQAKNDAIAQLQAAAAGDEDDTTDDVVVPTATYMAIKSATNTDDVDFYLANALK
jgi:hypothetical protein